MGGLIPVDCVGCRGQAGGLADQWEVEHSMLALAAGVEGSYPQVSRKMPPKLPIQLSAHQHQYLKTNSGFTFVGSISNVYAGIVFNF